MSRWFAPFLSGALFGLGLVVSGMARPQKVLGFLDLGGRWDPSLALVMGGAVAVTLPAFAYAARRCRTLTGEPLDLPPTRTIDWRLVAGSAVFGAGWGLAGLCPGPALVSLGFLSAPGVVFVAAMLLGQRLVK